MAGGSKSGWGRPTEMTIEVEQVGSDDGLAWGRSDELGEEYLCLRDA